MSEGSEFSCFGLGAQIGKHHWPKVFVLTWGIQSIHVSAEEQSCLEGCPQLGHRNRQKMSQRKVCLERMQPHNLKRNLDQREAIAFQWGFCLFLLLIASH